MNAPFRRNHTFYSLVALAAAAVLFVAVNILAGSWTQRLDLTQQRLYTLSPGSIDTFTLYELIAKPWVAS